MNLSQLKPPAGQQKTQKRVGRGIGSHRGKTSGRGMKGARSISGYSKMRGFEGGQMPLHRRLPKRGFSNAPFKKHFAELNVGRFEKIEGDAFDPAKLQEMGVVKKLYGGLRVLGMGDVKRKLHVKAHYFTPEAKKKIEAAGGIAELIVVKLPAPIKNSVADARAAKRSAVAAAKKK
jgi:large subunit ribosomal protein L15